MKKATTKEERLEGRRRRAEAWYNERIVFEDVNETAALVHSGVSINI